MNNTQAKAMVFNSANEAFTLKYMALPQLKEGEILVKITYTTICSSDLHTYAGRRNSPTPCILGHEIIGIILDLKNVVTDYFGNYIKKGDLITWTIYAFDKNNYMAKKGLPQKSIRLYKYGHHKLSDKDILNGGFASHCLLRKGTVVFKLPKNLTAKVASPLNCTHATIAGAIRLAGNIKNKNVLITGVGMLGLSACAMAIENGADNVYCTDIDKERLSFATNFGAKKLFSATLSATEINDQLKDNEKIDVVLDTTGVPFAMKTGISLLRIGGIAIWIGAVYNQKETQINAEIIVRNLLTIKGLHNYTPSDLGLAINFMSKNYNKYPFEALIGKEYNLAELSAAFTVANKGKYYRVGIKQ
ncbi:MAG: zinc-binding dehydrogenase [Tenacibaculum sp.]